MASFPEYFGTAEAGRGFFPFDGADVPPGNIWLQLKSSPPTSAPSSHPPSRLCYYPSSISDFSLRLLRANSLLFRLTSSVPKQFSQLCVHHNARVLHLWTPARRGGMDNSPAGQPNQVRRRNTPTSLTLAFIEPIPSEESFSRRKSPGSGILSWLCVSFSPLCAEGL